MQRGLLHLRVSRDCQFQQAVALAQQAGTNFHQSVATQLAAYLAPLEASRRAEEALANAQAEGDHLRYILDQVPEGIILYNAELQATSMNCAARALLGTDL